MTRFRLSHVDSYKIDAQNEFRIHVALGRANYYEFRIYLERARCRQ
jgi:hypothetical protein